MSNDLSNTPNSQKPPTILNPFPPFAVMIIIVVEEIITRVTNNDTKTRKGESSLILSGLCFATPLPKMVVFDNGRKIACETWSKRIGGMCMAEGKGMVFFTFRILALLADALVSRIRTASRPASMSQIGREGTKLIREAFL